MLLNLRRASLQQSIEDVSLRFSEMSVEEAQKVLVKMGSNFNETKNTDTTSNRDFVKVPGCTANVYLRAVRLQNEKWQLQGNADALLSRGLLAIVAHIIETAKNRDEIQALQPEHLADLVGLRSILSSGRNDGLASLLRTAQNQIKNITTGGSNEKDRDAVQLEASKKKTPTVGLLLSGGVDSSVALKLLVEQGYDVTAFYLKIWLEDELAHLGQCPWEDDYRMCKAVCEHVGVPLESISLQEAYREKVISYTVSEAEQGRTPNPDIMCNSRVKFGCFYDAIAERDFDFVASGHYAQLVRDRKGIVRLVRAPDPVKDQSYFLCALTQEQLSKVLFPIGHLQKSQVRALAEEFDLPNRNRPDSQGLCFLGKVKFDEFLGAYLGVRQGDIVDASTGEILGRHNGVWYHTVGQRKGIGKVLDPVATSRGPWYVVAKNPGKNLIFCSNKYDEDVFTSARSEFAVENIHWIIGTKPDELEDNGFYRLKMKIRHGPKIVDGHLSLSLHDSREGEVRLDSKDGGLAPGQFVAFYIGSECLGSGIISERHWASFLTDQEDELLTPR